MGRSLLEGNKDHLLSQARSEFMSQTSKLDLSMIVSENFSNKLTLKAHNHGDVESRREQARLQEEFIVHDGKISPRYANTSHVPSQPEVIPSSSSMLSRDKRQPCDSWNALGLQENAFGSQFSTVGSPGKQSQGIHHGETRRETQSVPRASGTGTSFAIYDEQNKGTIPMPMFARRPSTTSSSIPMDFPHNSMVGQQKQQISELQFDKFLILQSFFVGR